MVVRDACRDDFIVIAEIYGQSVLAEAASFETDPPDVDEMMRRWQVIVENGYPFLVAANTAGAILGYTYANAYRPRVAYRATVENSVYVGAKHRRQGVARQLLTELLARCRDAGFKQMIAVIGDPENSGSVALHAALGFRTIGTLHAVGCKFERWVDSTYMQRAL